MQHIAKRRSDVAGQRSVPEPALRIRNLSKRYAVRRTWSQIVRAPLAWTSTHALRGISLEVAAGEVVGLLGANGAGKTTLLKILSTLILPDGGRAEIFGFDVERSAREVRMLVAPIAADERSLEWRLNAQENLLFYAALCGVRPAEARTRVRELLERVELRASDAKLVGQYSSGMRQRLLVARALLRRPRLLLLDEPTRSMDPIAARSFRSLVRNELVSREQCTILVATHDPEEALEMCDRIAIMDRGRLLAIDTPDALAGEYGDDVFCVSTSTPAHPAFSRWQTSVVHESKSGDELTRVDMRFDPGTDAADVLNELVLSGARIHGFERVRPSLADIIERVTARQGRPAGE